MAKKFTYRLEPLLNLRAFRTNQAKEELAKILRLRFRKEQIIEEKIEYKNNLIAKKYTSGKASDIQERIAHKALVEKEIEKHIQDKNQLLEIEKLRQNKYIEAKKDEMILAKLKEKKLEEYKAETLKEESNFIDEIAIMGFIRKEK
ncbi:MAG: flagellar export protein FliJ [Ignavibacteria bacterium]|nr:flagellar export protein FliJ [Ignavibacteria bacterium]